MRESAETMALDGRRRTAHVAFAHDNYLDSRGSEAAREPHCLGPIRHLKESLMFSWAIAFFVIALLAALFGFTGLAASAAGIAKIIFIVALILAIISFVAGRRGPP